MGTEYAASRSLHDGAKRVSFLAFGTNSRLVSEMRRGNPTTLHSLRFFMVQAQLITSTERAIAPMQEYRTRLTIDLGTGKLDVREGTAKLPQVEAEPATEEALEEIEEVETEEAEL